MKKKLLIGLMLIFVLTLANGCGKKEVSENDKSQEKVEEKVDNFEQKIENMEKDENGEITSGLIEGYKFTETDKVTERVKIQMQDDSIILIVLSNSATPKTIANFQNLVKEKFYDGLTFHRVYKGFMIQGGDPLGTGSGGSDKKIKGEFISNGVKNTMSHTRGVISMARATDPNSASSQFFIMHADNTSLDGAYAAFGRVFAGMDAVDNIANTEVVNNGYGEVSKPVNPPVIKSIRFINIEKAE